MARTPESHSRDEHKLMQAISTKQCKIDNSMGHILQSLCVYHHSRTSGSARPLGKKFHLLYRLLGRSVYAYKSNLIQITTLIVKY